MPFVSIRFPGAIVACALSWRAIVTAIRAAPFFLILGYIDLSVPAIPNKIHGFPAGIVFTAIFLPFFCMPGRNSQVKGFFHHPDRRGMDHDRFPVNDLRLREIANVNTAVKARLANTHGYTDIGCLRRDSQNDQGDDT